MKINFGVHIVRMRSYVGNLFEYPIKSRLTNTFGLLSHKVTLKTKWKLMLFSVEGKSFSDGKH